MIIKGPNLPHRYAIFTVLYAPHAGGVEIFSANLAHQLALEGDKVTVVTSRLGESSPSFEVQEDGVEVWRLPCFPLMNGRLPLPKKNLEYIGQMRQLRELSYDGVLVNNRFYEHSLGGLRLAKDVGAPAVVLDHGTDWLTLGNPVADTAIRAHERLITERVKHFDPIFAGISKKSAEWLKTFGIDTDFVIPNAINAKAFRKSRSKRDFRAEFGLDKDSKIVAFTGRLTPEKGPDILAEAMRDLDATAFLAGEGFLRTKIESMSLDNVKLLGLLSREDLSALLFQADVFCLPTRSEGYCLAFLEASAWGIPSVIPNVGVIEDVLGPNMSDYILKSLDTNEVAGKLSACLKSNEGRNTELMEKVDTMHSWSTSTTCLKSIFKNQRMGSS